MIALLGLLACGGGAPAKPHMELPGAWAAVVKEAPPGGVVTKDEAAQLVLDYGEERLDQVGPVGQAWVVALESSGWDMDDQARPMGPARGWQGEREGKKISLFSAPSRGHLTVTLLLE